MMNIIEKIISYNFSSRNGFPITRITLHTPVANVDSLFSWFNKDITDASTHYFINLKGGIERYVSESNMAWANSNGDSNRHSITIECGDGGKPDDPVRTDAMYNSAIELVADLCKRYNIPCVLVDKSNAINWAVKGIDLHRYFSNKSCPAGLDVNRIITGANKLLQGINMPKTIVDYTRNGRVDMIGWTDSQVTEWLNKEGRKEIIKQLILINRFDPIQAEPNYVGGILAWYRDNIISNYPTDNFWQVETVVQGLNLQIIHEKEENAKLTQINSELTTDLSEAEDKISYYEGHLTDKDLFTAFVNFVLRVYNKYKQDSKTSN